MAEVIILGDSHVHAIQRAHIVSGRAPVAGRRTFVARIEKRVNAAEPVATGVTFEDAVEMIGRLGPEDLVVSVLGGNEFNMFGMIQHPVPFDYIEPDMAIPLRRDAQMIPCRVLETMLETSLIARNTPRIALLRNATAAPLVQLAAPPPKEDEAFVLSRADQFFRDRGVAILGISPAALRLKLWYTYHRLLRRACAAMDVTVLPPPDAAITPDGFLDPAYYGHDATHANADYGRLVLEMLDRHATMLEQAA